MAIILLSSSLSNYSYCLVCDDKLSPKKWCQPNIHLPPHPRQFSPSIHGEISPFECSHFGHYVFLVNYPYIRREHLRKWSTADLPAEPDDPIMVQEKWSKKNSTLKLDKKNQMLKGTTYPLPTIIFSSFFQGDKLLVSLGQRYRLMMMMMMIYMQGYISPVCLMCPGSCQWEPWKHVCPRIPSHHQWWLLSSWWFQGWTNPFEKY